MELTVAGAGRGRVMVFRPWCSENEREREREREKEKEKEKESERDEVRQCLAGELRTCLLPTLPDTVVRDHDGEPRLTPRVGA